MKTPNATYIESDNLSLVEYKLDGNVGVVELTNNRKMNTYSHAFFQQMDNAILEARYDDEAKVILIRNRLPGAFSAGAEITYLQACTPGTKGNFCLHANETLSKFEQTPKVVIAAMNGHTVGGGLEIAMSADVRIMARGSTEGKTYRVGLPESNLGVLPGTGGTQRLARIIGNSQAIDLMITGRLLTADEAMALGLVNYVFDGDKFDEGLSEYLNQLLSKPSFTIGLIKRAVVSGTEMSLHEGLTLERELQNRLFGHPNAVEGTAAYMEKRDPNWVS